MSEENAENAGNGGFKISRGWWWFILFDVVLAAVIYCAYSWSTGTASVEQAAAPQVGGARKQPSADAAPQKFAGAEEQPRVALEPRSTLDSDRPKLSAKPVAARPVEEWLAVRVNLCQDNRPGFDKCLEVPAQALVGHGYWYCVSDENLPPDQRIDYMKAGDRRYEPLERGGGFTCGGEQRNP